VSVMGQDRPGILAAATDAMAGNGCNIENVSQTILQQEFAGVFIISLPDDLPADRFHRLLQDRLKELDMDAHVKAVDQGKPSYPFPPSEAFIITTRGPDRKGLVAGITGVLAAHRVNVTNLQAVFKGGDDPGANTMIYEVDIPTAADQGSLRRELTDKAEELGIVVSIQHRRIFEATNRV